MSEPEHQQVIALEIPTKAGHSVVEIKVGKLVYVLGRNGTGKSALIQRAVAQIREPVCYVPGSRASMFLNDSLTLTRAAALQHEQSATAQDKQPGPRYRPWNDRMRNEKSIYDLDSPEIQFKIDAAEEIRVLGAAAPAIALLQSNTSPVDRINSLLKHANLEVRIIVNLGELKAERDGQVFSLAKMSDGERSAVVLASEIITAVKSTVFIIDEPERHLHRAIRSGCC